MSLSTYSLNNGGQADVDPIFERYSSAFRQAVEAAIGGLIPETDTAGNLDLQLFDTSNQAFAAGFEGAYVTNTGAKLNQPSLLIFANPEDGDDEAEDKGVDVKLKGDETQFVGLTDRDDKLTIKVSASDDDMMIDAANGDDTIGGGNGADTLFGGNGEDEVRGGRGDDSIDGGDGDDKLWGGSDDDVIHGGGDNDTIYGDAGDDRLYGDDGDDSIVGGTGATTVDGGSGFDVAVIKGNINDFFWNGDHWASEEDSSEIYNTECVRLNGNKILITVDNAEQADVARLFQMLTNADPTAQDLHAYLQDFANGASLSEIAGMIEEGIDDDGPLDNETSLTTYVSELVSNAFDNSSGAPDIDGIVNGLLDIKDDWYKSEIAEEVVRQLAAANDHIHIAINPSSSI